MPFSPDELARYQRHLSLAGFGPDAQAKLKGGSVLVVGAGGLGCPALLYLAAAGVGRIVIVDGDRVDVSTLQRQVLYAADDAGELKADAAARRLRGLNPLVAIEPRAERFTRANALALVRTVDVVIDGSDNFGTRYLVNDACVLAERPFVYGAIQAFEGQLSVFNWRGGPTYRCLFPEPPAPGTTPNCAEAGVLGVLPGLIGTAQACEAIKLLAGIGEPLSGRLLLWDALSMRTQTVSLASTPAGREVRDLPPDGYGDTCAWPAGDDELSIAEARALFALPRPAQVIDVREPWERALGAIEPSLGVPLAALESGAAAAALAQLDATAPTIVYCASGVRSRRGGELLRERYGFRAVSSLRGGMNAWSDT